MDHVHEKPWSRPWQWPWHRLHRQWNAKWSNFSAIFPNALSFTVLLQSPLFIWSHQTGHCHQLAHDLSCIRSFTRQFIVYSRRALGLQFWYRCRHFSSCTVVQVGFCLCIKRFPYSNCGKNKSFLAIKLISVSILCHGWADNLIIPIKSIYLVTKQYCRTTIIHKL